MKKNFEILLNYIKDLSVEITDAKTLILSREYFSKYIMGINIKSNHLENENIEVVTILNYKDPGERNSKSYFEITYATIIKIINKNIEKEELERIILIEVQKEIYPKLEKIFLGIIRDSGFPNLKLEKKIDFEELYKSKFN